MSDQLKELKKELKTPLLQPKDSEQEDNQDQDLEKQDDRREIELQDKQSLKQEEQKQQQESSNNPTQEEGNSQVGQTDEILQAIFKLQQNKKGKGKNEQPPKINIDECYKKHKNKLEINKSLFVDWIKDIENAHQASCYRGHYSAYKGHDVHIQKIQIINYLIKNLTTKESSSKSSLTFLSDMDDFFVTLDNNTAGVQNVFIKKLQESFQQDVEREFKTHILEILIIMFGAEDSEQYKKFKKDFFRDQFHPKYIRNYNKGIELNQGIEGYNQENTKKTVINKVREAYKINDLFTLIYHVLFTSAVEDLKNKKGKGQKNRKKLKMWRQMKIYSELMMTITLHDSCLKEKDAYPLFDKKVPAKSILSHVLKEIQGNTLQEYILNLQDLRSCIQEQIDKGIRFSNKIYGGIITILVGVFSFLLRVVVDKYFI